MRDIGECLKENMEAEKVEKNTENEMWFCLSCYRPLGKFFEDTPEMGRMEIPGREGEIYEVCFNYIKVFCPKCGKENCIHSNIPEFIKKMGAEGEPTINLATGDMELGPPLGLVELARQIETPFGRNFFELPAPKLKILLKKLSTRQKAEYRLLLANIKWINSEEGNIPRELIKEISKKEGLPTKKIVENLNIIINEIKVLKG